MAKDRYILGKAAFVMAIVNKANKFSRAALHPETSVRKTSPVSRPVVLKGMLPLPVLLYLLAVITPIRFTIGPLLFTGLRFYLILLIIPLMLRLLSGRLGGIFAIDVLFILHIVWMMVALTMNNPDMVVTQVGSVGVEFLGGYLIGRAYIQTPEAFAALCRWVILIVVCSVPFAVAESMTGRSIIIDMIQKIPGVFSVADVNNPPRLGLERAQVMFVHPIHYGLFCSVAMSLCFVALKGQISQARRYLLSAVVMFSGFLALSSGALLAIVLQIYLVIWAALFDKIRWRWWLLAGLLCFTYIVIDLLSNRSPLQVFMSYATFSAHNAYWRATIFEWGMKNVWDNPIFGIGFNDWVRPWYMFSGSMDNFWLVMAVSYGIPGFLFLAVGYVLGIFRVMRRNFDADVILLNLRRAWLFSFLGLSFTLSTVHVWTNIYSFVFFLFGAGIWFITVTPDSKADETSAPAPQERLALPYTRFPQRTLPPPAQT